jgi:plasmid stabilization system protein ParE
VRRAARFVLTPAARDDLTEISTYLRQDSPEAARRVRAELREAMRRLAQSPRMGHIREDLTDAPARFWSVYSYIIVYDPRPNRFRSSAFFTVSVTSGASWMRTSESEMGRVVRPRRQGFLPRPRNVGNGRRERR